MCIGFLGLKSVGLAWVLRASGLAPVEEREVENLEIDTASLSSPSSSSSSFLSMILMIVLALIEIVTILVALSIFALCFNGKARNHKVPRRAILWIKGDRLVTCTRQPALRVEGCRTCFARLFYSHKGSQRHLKHCVGTWLSYKVGFRISGVGFKV